MKRRNAHPYYFFPDHYFRQLRELLGQKLIYIAVTDKNGVFASGGLFTLFGNVMQYHLGATADEVVHFSPSKLMMDAAIEFGLVNGASLLHLGGGLGGSVSDGLFRFKKGFGQNYHPYSSLRFIHQPEEYMALKPEDSGFSKNNDYFPEYRYKSAIL
jgi:lipid II:glycine glycyltransferase (peptidoglycan interpeptide bridge formation enzyme)